MQFFNPLLTNAYSHNSLFCMEKLPRLVRGTIKWTDALLCERYGVGCLLTWWVQSGDICRRPPTEFSLFLPKRKTTKIFCSKQGHQKIKYQHCRGAVFRFAYSFQRMLLNQQECQVFQTASNTLLHVDLFILSIILWGLNNLEKRIIANNFAMFSLSGFKTLIKYITCSMQRK